MIRIVAGRFRGRFLKSPAGLETRPTSARTRKALFDILGGRPDGARVADCFAGTGALGIEALSRGAERVDFYESGRTAAAALRENLAALGVTSVGTIITAPLPTGIRSGPAYDLVFMDPPWRQGLEASTVARLVEAGRLGPETLVVVERDVRDTAVDAALQALGLRLTDQRAYGDTALSMFELAAADPDPVDADSPPSPTELSTP